MAGSIQDPEIVRPDGNFISISERSQLTLGNRVGAMKLKPTLYSDKLFVETLKLQKVYYLVQFTILEIGNLLKYTTLKIRGLKLILSSRFFTWQNIS